MMSVPPPLGTRQLFVYWKLAATDLEAALAALGDSQRRLVEALPGLNACRYVRVGRGLQATLMETYSFTAATSPTGLTDDDIAHIDAAIANRTQPWCAGGRHCEVFDALPS